MPARKNGLSEPAKYAGRLPRTIMCRDDSTMVDYLLLLSRTRLPRMRILQVNHQFPPFTRQGSELHCWQLSGCLAGCDDVAVFHASEVIRKKPARLERSSPDGYAVFHSIDGGHYARRANWPNPVLRRHFQSALDEWRPDIVHFHNYVSLGDDLPTMAKTAGAAVVYTLHDYGLICPNHLLLRTDGRLCGKSHGDFFEGCCPVELRVTRNRMPPPRRHLPALYRWRVYAAQQAGSVTRGILKAALSIPALFYGAPETAAVEHKRDFFFEHTRRIFKDVDLFICPSRFLMERFRACGLPAGKSKHIRYGIRTMQPNLRKDSNDGRIRFGFIGAFHAHKGLELLVQAFRGLESRAQLRIHGSAFGGPVAESFWRRIQADAPPGLHFGGAYRNEDLERILSEIDVVVVPSLWYENAPFTIQEAFRCGLPVITANAGGMAEHVRDRIDGLHFRIGDADDLRRCMLSVIEDPALLHSLRRHSPELPSLESTTRMIREQYGILRSRG